MHLPSIGKGDISMVVSRPDTQLAEIQGHLFSILARKAIDDACMRRMEKVMVSSCHSERYHLQMWLPVLHLEREDKTVALQRGAGQGTSCPAYIRQLMPHPALLCTTQHTLGIFKGQRVGYHGFSQSAISRVYGLLTIPTTALPRLTTLLAELSLDQL